MWLYWLLCREKTIGRKVRRLLWSSVDKWWWLCQGRSSGKGEQCLEYELTWKTKEMVGLDADWEKERSQEWPQGFQTKWTDLLLTNWLRLGSLRAGFSVGAWVWNMKSRWHVKYRMFIWHTKKMLDRLLGIWKWNLSGMPKLETAIGSHECMGEI